MVCDQDVISGYKVNKSCLVLTKMYKVKSVYNSQRFPGSYTDNIPKPSNRDALVLRSKNPEFSFFFLLQAKPVPQTILY